MGEATPAQSRAGDLSGVGRTFWNGAMSDIVFPRYAGRGARGLLEGIEALPVG